MKNLILSAASTAALAAAALVPAVASAQDAPASAPTWMSPSFYGTLGYSDTSLDHVNLGAIQARLGARFTPYIGAEVEGSWGVNDDDRSLPNGARLNEKLTSQEAVYGVGYLPINPNVELLARIGYGHTSGTGSIAGVTPGVRGDSWNFGVGGQYMFDPKNGIRLDYTREVYQPRDSDDANVWAISYVRKF